MFAILGATGKVGRSTIATLRQAGTPVRAILRDETKATEFRAMGCEVALADLRNVDALSLAIADADAVQIILPPPFAAEDAVGDMRRSIDGLAEALGRAHPARLVAVSDYGAHVGEWIGMPSVFRLFEERLRELAMPKVLLRSEGAPAFGGAHGRLGPGHPGGCRDRHPAKSASAARHAVSHDLGAGPWSDFRRTPASEKHGIRRPDRSR
jgi:uncharacterized protein YbjT (DUF2867 family)